MFHVHCCSEGHEGIENCSVTLKDQVEDLGSLKTKGLYWINRPNTWILNGVNVREVSTESKKKKTFLEKAKVSHSHTHENVF